MTWVSFDDFYLLSDYSSFLSSRHCVGAAGISRGLNPREPYDYGVAQDLGLSTTCDEGWPGGPWREGMCIELGMDGNSLLLGAVLVL